MMENDFLVERRLWSLKVMYSPRPQGGGLIEGDFYITAPSLEEALDKIKEKRQFSNVGRVVSIEDSGMIWTEPFRLEMDGE